MTQYIWTETNTNYIIPGNFLTAPVMQDFHPAPVTTGDTMRRSIWWPRVDVRVDRATGAPTAYWWLGSTINLAVVWDENSSFPQVNANSGLRDTRNVGTCSLIPRAVVYDSTFAVTVTYYLEGGPLELESQRKGHGGEDVPQVIGEVWGFDHYGVFDGSHGTHVVAGLSMISAVLWSVEGT